jgi:hypothetical protein
MASRDPLIGQPIHLPNSSTGHSVPSPPSRKREKMLHPEISRVSRAAQNKEFDTDWGFVADRPNEPVACSVAAAIFAGAACALLTAAGVVEAHHHFGRHHDLAEPITCPRVEHDSVDRLVDARLVTIAS